MRSPPGANFLTRPMTRPATSPPRCMKLSMKGVKPMQTCLGLGAGIIGLWSCVGLELVLVLELGFRAEIRFL